MRPLGDGSTEVHRCLCPSTSNASSSRWSSSSHLTTPGLCTPSRDRHQSLRRWLLAGAGAVVGLAVLVVGAAAGEPVVGVLGFVLMFVSVVMALSPPRRRGPKGTVRAGRHRETTEGPEQDEAARRALGAQAQRERSLIAGRPGVIAGRPGLTAPGIPPSLRAGVRQRPPSSPAPRVCTWLCGRCSAPSRLRQAGRPAPPRLR